MKKFVFASICTFALVGIVMADEFTASITKTDGKTVDYFKTKKGGGGGKGGGKGGGGTTREGDEIKGKAVSANVKVVKGVFDADTKSVKAGDAVEGGLTNEMFKTIDAEKGVNVTLTIADDGADKGKITQIMVGGKGGGKGAGKKKGG